MFLPYPIFRLLSVVFQYKQNFNDMVKVQIILDKNTNLCGLFSILE